MRFLPLLSIGAGLLYLSLLPWTFNFNAPFHHPAWQLPDTPGEIVDSVLNLLVYVPLGFAALRSGLGLWPSILGGFLLSTGIEYLQVFLPSRDSSWRDVLLNTLGTALGCILARLPIIIPALPRLSPAGLLCAAFWFAAHCFPFLPVIRMSSVYKLQHTLASLHWDGNSALDTAAVGVLLFLLLPRKYALGALLIPLLLEPLIIGQQLQASAFAGAILGIGLGFALPEPHAALLLVSWILMRQLQPFHWSEEASAFHWIPFASLSDMPATAYLRILMLKLLLYSGAMLLMRRSGIRWIHATISLLVLLGISEALQTHLPGRTPESTDLALALFGALATSRMSNEPRSAS